MFERSIARLKYACPSSLKTTIRRARRALSRRPPLRASTKLSAQAFRKIVSDELGIQAGDTVLAHSSFRNLNPDFSPEEAVNILLETITEEGNLLMPFYPASNAYFWLVDRNVFDVASDKTTTGVLTRVLAGITGARKSPHPAKSLVVHGRDRDPLISEHCLSLYPFDEKSPYFKGLNLNAKTIGLGVEINSFFHSCEDMHPKIRARLYSETLFTADLRYYNGERISCKTYMHDPAKIANTVPPCDFLKSTGCPNYSRYVRENSVFYTVPHKNVYAHCEELFAQDIDRIALRRRR